MERVLEKIDPTMRVLNEGRYLSIFFPKSWSSLKKSELLSEVVSNADIDIVASRENSAAVVQSKKLNSQIYYSPANCAQGGFAITVTPNPAGVMKASTSVPMCPESLDFETNQMYYPYFISNLSRYFEAPGHPDAVIIPMPGVTFKNNNYLGQHGGPTPREVFVPLLLHNASLGSRQSVPALWELLGFM